MKIRVNRPNLLEVLESVAPGLSSREIVEQASSFVFKNGFVITLNGEISCRMKSHLAKEFTASVPSSFMLNILRQLPEDELLFEIKDKVLLIRGKEGRETQIKIDPEILLPVHSVEPPKDWSKLPEDFSEAISIVHECASDDQQSPILTFVHITKDFIEACDLHQMARYKMKLPIVNPTLVRKDSIKHILQMEVSDISVTDSWMHFRNASGLVFSCLRFIEKYPSLDDHLTISKDAVKAKLPKGLVETAKRAEIFSNDNQDKALQMLQIDMKSGKLRVIGAGNIGKHTEPKDLVYEGPPLKFNISAKMLVEITKKYNECRISSTALYVPSGKWLYVNALEVPSTGGDDSNTEMTEAEAAGAD